MSSKFAIGAIIIIVLVIVKINKYYFINHMNLLT